MKKVFSFKVFNQGEKYDNLPEEKTVRWTIDIYSDGTTFECREHDVKYSLFGYKYGQESISPVGNSIPDAIANFLKIEKELIDNL